MVIAGSWPALHGDSNLAFSICDRRFRRRCPSTPLSKLWLLKWIGMVTMRKRDDSVVHLSQYSSPSGCKCTGLPNIAEDTREKERD